MFFKKELKKFFFGCTRASLLLRLFSSYGELGLVFVVEGGLLSGVASSAVGCRLWVHVGFSSCGMWAQELQLLGSRAQAQSCQSLWRVALVAPRHVGLSLTRDQTRVSGIGGQILYH